MNYSE
jgi:hypothetical protein